MRIWAGKGWVTYTKAQIEQSPHGSRSPQLLGTVSASLPAPLPLRTGSQGTRGTRVRNNNWGKSFPVPAAPAARRLSSIGVWHGSGAGTGSGGALEARGPYQHAGALQRVAGTLEIVPADAVELADVVPGRVVDPVQVGEPAGVEPPACGRRERGGSVLRGWAPGWGGDFRTPAPAPRSPPDSIWAHLQRQLSLSASRVLKLVPCRAKPLCCPAVPL